VALKISVIVIGFNEEGTIERLMQGLRAQTRLPDEIVYVDGHSTDGTASIAARYADLVLTDDRQGAARARNLGVAAATGDVLLFIDSDSYPADDWVERMAQHFEDGCIAVGGFVLPYDGDRWARWTFHGVNIINHFARAYGHGGLHGSNCGYLRQVFIDNGGFPSNYTMYEDVALSHEVCRQGRVEVDPHCVVWSSTRRLQQVGIWENLWVYLNAFIQDRDRGEVKERYFDTISH
jgi:glycosyltransferase involved in cell wall biosynthesis